MQSFLRFKPLHIYNILLFIIFCVIVNSSNQFQIFYTSLYCIFHLLLVYLGLYHFRNLLYPIFFLYGLGLDILLLNEIGPHLLVFMISIIIIKILTTYLSNLNSIRIYFFLISFQLMMIFSEIFFSYLIVDIRSDYISLLNIAILTLMLSYPSLIIFSRIDKIK